MAWEPFQRGRVQGITGDDPFNEMHAALRRIRIAYLERFGRSPHFVELLHALEGCVASQPGYVDATPSPLLASLSDLVAATCPVDFIDPQTYVAGLDEEDGDFRVYPDSQPPVSRAEAVLRGVVIDEEPNRVLCRYTILKPSITDGMARCLIRMCVLQDLLEYNILDEKFVIRFEPSA